MKDASQTKKMGLFVGVVIVLAGIIFVTQRISVFHRETSSVAPVNDISTATQKAELASLDKTKPVLPHGSQTYQIMQAGNTWPKITAATIDPPDVHVGFTQKLSITLQTKSPIVSVVAEIQTDHSTKNLPLEALNGVSYNTAPGPYMVDADNHIVPFSVTDTASNVVPSAQATDNPPSVTYSGSWTVNDTHDTFYHTTFIVKDAAGEENSVTLAWSDACGIPNGGNWTMSSACSISANAVDGADGGNVTLSSGTLTLSSSTFVVNSGKSITLSGGSIAISGGGKIQQTNLWLVDADGDSYPGGSTEYAASNTPGASYVRRNVVGGSSIDCNDSNANIFQFENVGDDYDHDGYAVSYYQTRCVGASQTISGRTYYKDQSGITALVDASSALGYSDCDDNNAFLQVNEQSYADLDGDWSPVDNGMQCTSAASCGSMSSYDPNVTYLFPTSTLPSYTLSSNQYGSCSVITGINHVVWPDCNDLNSGVFQYISGACRVSGQDGGSLAIPQVCVGSEVVTTSATGTTVWYYLDASGQHWQNGFGTNYCPVSS